MGVSQNDPGNAYIITVSPQESDMYPPFEKPPAPFSNVTTPGQARASSTHASKGSCRLGLGLRVTNADMYTCMYVCLHVCTRWVCMYACTYVPVHAWLYANMRTAYVYTLVRGHRYTRAYIPAYLITPLPAYTCIPACIQQEEMSGNPLTCWYLVARG